MLAKPGLFKRSHDATTVGLSTPLSVSSTNVVKPLPVIPNYSAEVAPSATPAPQVASERKPDMVEAPEPSSSSSLIVGPDVKLKGAEILDCDTLVVEGRVEATMDSRVIRIAADGSFSGKVGIDVAEVFGRFDGELTARSQLIIHATGRVSGKIRYGKILIEEGGELSGDVATLTTESSKVNNLHIAASKNIATS
jgi:cytoskeletal protein CcmA (bactofilin family)